MGGRNTIIPVPAAEASKWRDELDWYFSSFVRNGSLNKEDLWADIATKQRQLWVLRGQAVVLTMVKDDNYKTCVVTHAAGRNMREWVHLWEYLEAWARGIGCERIQAIARPGWERVLTDMKKTHVVLEKRL